MKKLCVFALAAVMAMTLSACVSQSDYDEAVRSLDEAQKAGDELVLAKDELASLQVDYAAAKDEISALTEENSSLKEQAEGALASLAEAQTALTEAQGETQKVQDALAQAQEDLASKDALLAAAEDELAAQKGLLADAQALNASLQESFDVLTQEYADYRHQAEGGRLVVPDDILQKYELLAQEASQKVQTVLDEELVKLKEEAQEAIKGLLVAPDDSREPGTYDPSYFFK